MFNILLMSADTTVGAGAGGSSNIFMVLMLGVLGVTMWFSSRTRKKEENATKNLQASIEVGDEVLTIGGIVGRVVRLEETTILIESGADRSRLRLTRNAIHKNTSAEERALKISAEKAEAAKQRKAK